MTLEEIDYLFTNPDKGPVKLSKAIAKERRKHGRVSIMGRDRGRRRWERPRIVRVVLGRSILRRFDLWVGFTQVEF